MKNNYSKFSRQFFFFFVNCLKYFYLLENEKKNILPIKQLNPYVPQNHQCIHHFFYGVILGQFVTVKFDVHVRDWRRFSFRFLSCWKSLSLNMNGESFACLSSPLERISFIEYLYFASKPFKMNKKDRNWPQRLWKINFPGNNLWFLSKDVIRTAPYFQSVLMNFR